MTQHSLAPKFSIIIATRLRLDLLKRCLESVRREFYDTDHEIIIALNGADETTSDFLAQYSLPNEQFFVVDPKEANGNARNRAMRVASGEYFFFLDDDAYLPEGYFKKASSIIEQNPDLQVFGGPDLTPPKSTDFEIAVGCTLASPLGTANTRFRHTEYENDILNATEKNLTLCNLWMSSEIFKVEKFAFHRTIERNEENILLSELASAAKSMHAYSKLYVFHKRRSSIDQFFNQQARSGASRIKSFLIHPKTFHPLFLVPFAFFTYALLLGLYTAISMGIPNLIFLLPIYLYVILLATYSLKAVIRSQKEKINIFKAVTYIPAIFVTIHLSYAWGSLSGVFSALSSTESAFAKNKANAQIS